MELDKRWKGREQRWVAPGLLFRKEQYSVDVLDEKDAKRFVVEEHYSGSFPAARLSVGLFGIHSRLEGVAVFSVPMNQFGVPKYTGFTPNEGCELGRFVCLPEVRYNGETWFLARAFDLVRTVKAEIRGTISYADPLERRAGQLVVKPAHYGTIYQASNALFIGRSKARTLLYAPNGQLISERSLSKIRGEERGWQYATQQLVAAGFPERVVGERLDEWVKRISNYFTRVKHPGNLTYVFGVDRAAREQIAAVNKNGLPYPKREAA
jgi:hypothetical protein